MMTSVAQICGHFGCSDKATIVQGKKKDVPEEGGGCSGPDISFLFFWISFLISLDFFLKYLRAQIDSGTIMRRRRSVPRFETEGCAAGVADPS